MSNIQKMEQRLAEARMAVLEIELALDQARRDEHYQRMRREVDRVVDDMKAGYQPLPEARDPQNPPRAR